MGIIVSRFFEYSVVLSEGGITATSLLNNHSSSGAMILFEKYQVTDIVYESDNVTVYAAEHIYMAAKRIIKKILKRSICRDSFYSEVKVLKSIKNPQIPIIYDVEEDNFAYFIIEEYVEGVNLHTFIEENGVISEEKAIDIGIKICDVVSFLHCQKPVPILFLDIHPKNILINTNDNAKISLVDFGSSYYSNETQKRKLLMGTVGYAAPEQYRHDVLDERADVYGIGAVLYFLVTGRSCDRENILSLYFPQNISEKFKVIIMQCMAPDRSDRLQNVDMVAWSLSKLKENDNINANNEKSHTISFAGVDRRVGVTHISLAFAVYLSKQGYNVLYEEANDSNHLRMIAGNEKLKYKNGFFYHNKLKLKPLYGEQVSLEGNSDYIIRDCGAFDENICKNSHIVVLMAAAKSWEIDNAVAVCKRAMNAGDIQILCNCDDKNSALSLWRRVGCVGMQIPIVNYIFENKDRDSKFFEELACAVGIVKKGGVANKKRARFFGKITEKARRNNSRHMGRS